MAELNIDKTLVNTAVAVGAGLLIGHWYKLGQAKAAKVPEGVVAPGPVPNSKTAVISRPAAAKAQLAAVRQQAASDVVVKAVATGNHKVVVSTGNNAAVVRRSVEGPFVDTGQYVRIKQGTCFYLDKSYVTKLESGFMVFKVGGAFVKINPGYLTAK